VTDHAGTQKSDAHNSLLVQIFCRPPTLTSLTFWWTVHRHTLCNTCTCHDTLSTTRGCQLRKTYSDLFRRHNALVHK
jgi:hypothetical protein